MNALRDQCPIHRSGRLQKRETDGTQARLGCAWLQFEVILSRESLVSNRHLHISQPLAGPLKSLSFHRLDGFR